MNTAAIPKGRGGLIPPNLVGTPPVGQILPQGVGGLIKNTVKRAPKLFGGGIGTAVLGELLFPRSTAKSALSEIDLALLYPPSSEILEPGVYPFEGGQEPVKYEILVYYGHQNQYDDNFFFTPYSRPTLYGPISSVYVYSYLSGQNPLDGTRYDFSGGSLITNPVRRFGGVKNYAVYADDAQGEQRLVRTVSFEEMIKIDPPLRQDGQPDTGGNPEPIVPPKITGAPGFTPVPLSAPTTPTESASSPLTSPTPNQSRPAKAPLIGSPRPTQATDTGGNLGSPYEGTEYAPILPSILPSATASNSGGLTTTRTRVKPNLSDFDRPLTTTTVGTAGGTATASSSTSSTQQRSLGTPLPSTGISVSNGAQTGVQVSTPTTATTTSVTQTPPATETVNLNPDFDWASILTPLLVGSYGTSQFRSEVKTQTEQAICNSTGTGGCVKNDVFSPLKSKLDDIFTGLGLIGEGANLSLSNSILNRVTDIQNQVNSPAIGLQATRNFLNNAWNSTIIDKSLNAANFVLTLHNSVLLSTNVAETVLQTLNVVLDIFGVTDAEGNPLDIAAFLTNALNKFATGVLGAETVTQLGVQLTALNRIYQAGMNILDNVTDLADTIIDLDEQTGENVAKIGNALRRSGSIDFNAYDQMVEDLDVRRRSKWLARLDAVEDLTDTIYAIADNIRDIKDIGLELKDNRNELTTILSEARTALRDTENQTETDISALPEPTESDELEGQESG